MFVMMDREETFKFGTVNEIAVYLGQVAASEYAEKVLAWAESDEETLFIPNGLKSTDIWYKRK